MSEISDVSQKYSVCIGINEEKVAADNVYVLSSVYEAVDDECQSHGFTKTNSENGLLTYSAECGYAVSWNVIRRLLGSEIKDCFKTFLWSSESEEITEDVLGKATVQGEEKRKLITMKFSVPKLKEHMRAVNRHYLLRKAVKQVESVLNRADFEYSKMFGGFISSDTMTYAEATDVSQALFNECEWLRDCATSFGISSVGKPVDMSGIIKKAADEQQQ